MDPQQNTSRIGSLLLAVTFLAWIATFLTWVITVGPATGAEGVPTAAENAAHLAENGGMVEAVGYAMASAAIVGAVASLMLARTTEGWTSVGFTASAVGHFGFLATAAIQAGAIVPLAENYASQFTVFQAVHAMDTVIYGFGALLLASGIAVALWTQRDETGNWRSVATVGAAFMGIGALEALGTLLGVTWFNLASFALLPGFAATVAYAWHLADTALEGQAPKRTVNRSTRRARSA